ncbi:MAG: SCP2 sterol-binding domain-containing protein [Gammaproteobacteria bacterium]|nr:SCP2 sterol-binding domain-containing protein [Gammaproteobacteria bacterium]
MQPDIDTTRISPLFPRLLSLPIAVVPDIVHSTAIVTVLNRIFAGALRDGELDFLQGRIMRVHVSDMRLTIRISLKRGRLVAVHDRRQTAALAITGALHAFLLLAARREDTDTLFFQRRLLMEGDTELGLEVKNFLDGQDMESLWLHRQVSGIAQKALPLYERTFS